MTDPIATPLQRSASFEFEEHASFLRSLARRLVQDTASADDLAQETLLAAITSTSRRTNITGPEARPWLARVMRRKAANRWRGDERRRARERAAARPEATDSAADSAAQIELAERLLGHVRELDPELQGAIIARFYHGLSLKDAARREGTPVTTIHSRIGRGLETIRAKLDAEEPGGRAAWLSGLSLFCGMGSGVGAAATAAASMGGRAGIGWVTYLGVAAATAAGVALLWNAPIHWPNQAPDKELPAVSFAADAAPSHSFGAATGGPNDDLGPARSVADVDPEQERVELTAKAVEDITATADKWTGRVTYIDDQGAEHPGVGVEVKWSTREPPEHVDSHGRLGYGGMSCLLYTSPSPRDRQKSRMPSSA